MYSQGSGHNSAHIGCRWTVILPNCKAYGVINTGTECYQDAAIATAIATAKFHTMEGEEASDDPLAELIICYNELNGSIIEELDEEPSPLEFMRYVSKNTPFVVRGGATSWEASTTWNVRFLRETLAKQTVNVAVTPEGFVCSL